VDGLNARTADFARVLDSGVDGFAGLGGEAFEYGRDGSWARCTAAAAGELGGAPLEERVINRRPVAWIGSIDERLAAAGAVRCPDRPVHDQQYRPAGSAPAPAHGPFLARRFDARLARLACHRSGDRGRGD
jgi:hypothetical protein